jgi:hypothetical protein
MSVYWDQSVEDALIDAIFEGVSKTAKEVLDIGNDLIRTPPKTGLIYKRYNPNRTHQASSAGEAPANDSGRLIASSYHEDDKANMVSYAVWNTEYAAALQFGYAPNNLAPRPFATMAVTRAPENLKYNISTSIKGIF